MNYLKFSLLLFIMLVFSCNKSYAKDPIPVPERPKNVPLEATWENFPGLWTSGDRENGNIILWQIDGTYLYREIIVKKDFKNSIRYHKNGKIHRIGQFRYFHDTYYRDDDDGSLAGWIKIGKWKEYNEEGNLIREWCETPNENGTGSSNICGEEIFFNIGGTIKEKKLKQRICKYGCEELEYKDSAK